jgi:DNA-binding SARP family transcriptional activator
MQGERRVQLLGEMQVIAEGKHLPLQGHRTMGPLFAFLAYHPRQQSRDSLIEHFWPDVGVESARLSLRVALSRLRKLIGEEGLVANVQQVGFTEGYFSIDTIAFIKWVEQAQAVQETEAKRHALEAAIALYQGPLLSAWTDDWILAERERMESMYLGAIHQLVGLLIEKEEWDTALVYTEKALLTAPLYEEMHRDRIQVFLKMGRPEAARRQYQELEIRRQKEHLPPPSAVTLALLHGRKSVALSLT